MLAKRIKWFHILLTVVCVAGLIGFFYNSLKKETVMTKVKADSQYGNVEIATLVNDGKTFNYAVNYPVFKNEKIDGVLKSFAEKEVRQFQKETKDVDQEHTKKRNELNVDYNIAHYAKQTVAIVFHEYQYISGAHGQTMTKTFNYDFSKQAFLSIDDIFKEDADYLHELSFIAYHELKKDKDIRADDALLKEGTAPKKENFSRFAIKQDYIEFYFDMYQVAAGYLGERSIAIKKSLLKDIVKEQYMDKEKTKIKLKSKSRSMK